MIRRISIVAFMGFVALLFSITAVAPASAQFTDDDSRPAVPGSAGEGDGIGIRLGSAKTQKWKIGVVIRALGGPCQGLFATVPVPTDWPEQSVRIVEEQVTDNVTRLTYRTLEDGGKQMLVQIPRLATGEEATALITFEITRNEILAPLDPTEFVFPKNVPRDISRYLGPSPQIESRHPQIVKLAGELTKDKESVWEQVEAIYDWVRENVEYKDQELKGALAALRDGDGDCEEMTSLIIALCRASKIPARTVWIPDHCYPEFYVLDREGNGHWIPCQAAGDRHFGAMPEERPVLQKGDNFKVPEKREPQRYIAEFLKGNSIRGGGKPEVQFYRIPVAE